MNRVVAKLIRRRWSILRILIVVAALQATWSWGVVPVLDKRQAIEQEIVSIREKIRAEERVALQRDSLPVWLSETEELWNRITPLRKRNTISPDTLRTEALRAGLVISSIQQRRDSTALFCDLTGQGSSEAILRFLRQLRFQDRLLRVEALSIKGEKGERSAVHFSALRLVWPFELPPPPTIDSLASLPDSIKTFLFSALEPIDPKEAGLSPRDPFLRNDTPAPIQRKQELGGRTELKRVVLPNLDKIKLISTSTGRTAMVVFADGRSEILRPGDSLRGRIVKEISHNAVILEREGENERLQIR